MESYPLWTMPFAEGSYYDGSWDQGSRIRFLTPSGAGMVAEIAENRPNQFMKDTWPKALESLKQLCEKEGSPGDTTA